MSKKITVADLLTQKEQLKNKELRKMDLYVESLDGEITIQEPSRAVTIEALKMAQDDSRSELADVYMVYHCVISPDIKDPNLQKEFGCVEPFDIVNMIFRDGEIGAISSHAFQLAGYETGVRKVTEELKN